MNLDLEIIAKKSQLRVYIVLVVIIVSLVLPVFLFRGFFSSDGTGFLDEVSEIKVYVENCLFEIGKEALKKIGNQGGLLEPDNFFEVKGNKIQYAFNGSNIFVQRYQLKEEISKFIESHIIGTCGLENVKDIKVEYENAEVGEINFESDEVVIELEWPIVVSRDLEEVELKSFSTEIPVRLDLIHEITGKIIEDPKRSNFDFEDGIDVTLIDYNETSVYVIIDDKSKFGKNSFRFLFAVKGLS